MHDSPDPDAILSIVADTIRDRLVPELNKEVRYEALIAANLIDIVRRELSLSQEQTAQARFRLQTLLKTDEEDVRELNAMLSKAIQHREIAADDPGLAQHLALTAHEKLQVDQPKFLDILPDN